MSISWPLTLLGFILVSIIALVSLLLKTCYRGYHCLAVIVSFVVISIAGYGYWGGYRGYAERGLIEHIDMRLNKLVALPSLSGEQVLDTLHQLESQSKASSYALHKLATVYSQIGEHVKAAGLLDQAFQMSAREEFLRPLIMQTSLAYNGHLSDDLRDRAVRLLTHDDFPLHNIIALDDYSKGFYEHAVSRWEWIMRHDPYITASGKARMQRAVDVSRTKAGLAPARVLVKVDCVTQNTDTRDNIFVSITKQDSRIPLAAVKIKGHDLNQTLSITSADMMLPGTELPIDEPLVVKVKRGSHADDAMAAKEVGKSDTFMVESNPKHIKISLSD